MLHHLVQHPLWSPRVRSLFAAGCLSGVGAGLGGLGVRPRGARIGAGIAGVGAAGVSTGVDTGVVGPRLRAVLAGAGILAGIAGRCCVDIGGRLIF